MIVRIDQSRKDKRVFEIQHRVGLVGRHADAVDAAALDPQRPRQAAVGADDAGVDECDRR
jgi:hypothetical protein